MRGYKPDPKHEQAYNLHQKGVSKAEIARRFSVSSTTAGWWINKFEHNLSRKPEYPAWAESLTTRSFLQLRHEVGDEVMKMEAHEARDKVMGIDLMKIPNLGKKSAQEIMDSLGADLHYAEPQFSESHAKACISYLEKWGYKVTPPDK